MARRSVGIIVGVLVVLVSAAGAQPDPLQGRWEGIVRAPQGERKATVNFRKEGDSYSGAISGVSGTTEIPFREVTREGDNVKAAIQIDAPQGAVVVQFDFVLNGETLSGKGEVSFGQQVLTFTYDMKRVGDLLAEVEVTPEQRLQYFVGRWNFEMTGRDSALRPGGTIAGTMTFEPVLDGKYLFSRLEGKADQTSIQSTGYLGYDSSHKVYTYFENLSGGAALLSTASWTGPGIRMETVPVKIGDQSVRLRRAISVVSDNTFTVVEELSVGGARYVRLSQGTFTKALQDSARSSP